MRSAARHAVAALLLLAAAAAQAVEVNTASQAELERVKGIGVALSNALLAERAKRPFADWRDLRARVGGIGRTQAERLSAAGLTVAGRPWAGAGAGDGAAASAAAR